jgi:hypothetical protein
MRRKGVKSAHDPFSRLYTAQVAVLGYGPDQLDALLQGKWHGMKTRLAAGDIEGAGDHMGRALIY